MQLSDPPIQNPISAQSGIATQVWVLFFQKIKQILSASEPWQLASYTVAGLPSAPSHEGSIVYVSNESGGKVIAFSDGISWRRCTDRNIVS